MNPQFRNNGTARHIGPGTIRRRRREAVQAAWVFKLYRETPDLPPTRQQLRASQRIVAKLEAHEQWITLRQNRRRLMRLRRSQKKKGGTDE